MATNTAITTKRLQALVANGVSPEAFDFTHTWYRNSERGAAHSARNCVKHTAWYGNDIQVKASPLTVTRPCEECFYEVFDRNIGDQIDIGTKLLSDLRRLRMGDEHAPTDAALTMERCSLLLTRLQRHRDSELLSPLVENLTEIVGSYRESLSASASGAADELVRICALSVIATRNDNKLRGLIRHDAEILGRVDEIHLAKALHQEWGTSFIRHGSIKQARADTMKLASLTHASSTAQLDFPATTSPHAGETQGEYAQRAWAIERDRITSAAITVWEATVASTLSNTHPGIVACEVEHTDDMPAALIATFSIARDAKHIVMLAPQVILDWYTTQVRLATGTIAIIESDKLNDLIGESPDRDKAIVNAAEAALGLWQPRQPGTYKSFEAAFAAGLRL